MANRWEEFIQDRTQSGETKFIDGRSMTLNQALGYINQTRANDYQKYQELIRIMNASGYSIPETQNQQTVIRKWDTFVRDLFMSQEQDVFSFVEKRRSDSSGDGTSTASYPSLTDKATAFFDLDSAFRDYANVTADKKEREQYYKELNALESSRPTQQVTRRVGNRTVQTTIGGVTQEEKENLLLKFVAKKVQGTDLADIAGKGFPILQTIRTTAKMMGVVLSDENIRKLAVSAIRGTPMETIEQKISSIAKAKFPSLAPYIDGGTSVMDVASQFIAEKSDMLGININQIDLTDNDVYQAISGNVLEPISDFRKRMRQNPIFQYTDRAREEMSNYVEEVLQRFGLV